MVTIKKTKKKLKTQMSKMMDKNGKKNDFLTKILWFYRSFEINVKMSLESEY